MFKTVSKSSRVGPTVVGRRTAQKGVVGVKYGSRCPPARLLFLLRNSRRVPYLRESTPRLRAEETPPRTFRRPVSTGNVANCFRFRPRRRRNVVDGVCRRRRKCFESSRRFSRLTIGSIDCNCRSQRQAGKPTAHVEPYSGAGRRIYAV